MTQKQDELSHTTPDDPENTWLTRKEVSVRLKVPVNTLTQWAYLKTGPRYAAFGRAVRYRLADLVAWENAQYSDIDA